MIRYAGWVRILHLKYTRRHRKIRCIRDSGNIDITRLVYGNASAFIAVRDPGADGNAGAYMTATTRITGGAVSAKERRKCNLAIWPKFQHERIWPFARRLICARS